MDNVYCLHSKLTFSTLLLHYILWNNYGLRTTLNKCYIIDTHIRISAPFNKHLLLINTALHNVALIRKKAYRISIHVIDRGFLIPYFMKTPLYCLPPPFSSSVQQQPPPPHPTPLLHSYCPFCCHVSLTEWYLMILWIYTCCALLP